MSGMTRRRFLGVSAAAAGAYCLGRGEWFLRGEKYDLHLTEWDVPVPHLPAPLDGLRVAHFSDLHLTPEISQDYLASALGYLDSLHADAIFFTGDLLSSVPRYLAQWAPALASLSAPHGKFAVMGNHDFFFNRRDTVVRTWQESGWEILRNRNVAMSGTNSRVWIVGVDDPVTGREDVAQALVGVPPGVCRIGMGHSPDLVAELPPDSVDLLLCGHTHGGQIVLPLLGPPAVNAQLGAYYAWGLFNYQGTMLEVTRGVGMVHPLYRLNCPPEIALLTLHPAPQPLPTDPFPCRTRRLHSVGESLRERR